MKISTIIVHIILQSVFCGCSGVITFPKDEVSSQYSQECDVTTTIKGLCQEPAKCMKELESVLKDGHRLNVCEFRENRAYLVCCPAPPTNFLTKTRDYIKRLIGFKDTPSPIMETKKTTNEKLIRISEKKCVEYATEQIPFSEVVGHTVVVGGKKAWAYQFPHIAAIGWYIENRTDFHCGGTLISPNYVLTAGHCTIFEKKLPDIIRLGDSDLTVDKNDPDEQEFEISTIVRHPEYKSSSYYHDIALIKLKGTAKTTNSVRPACVSIHEFLDIFYLTAVGYGQTSFGGSRSDDLQKVLLKRSKTEDCGNSYPPARKMPNGVIKGQLCAADPEAKMDTCQGDSGGPLSIRNNSAHYVIGITSIGMGCATSVPSIYTRVSEYIDWIESVVW